MTGVLSGALFFAARRSERLANLSSLAVPLVDMPAVFLVQLANISTSSNPRAVANFTLGVYLLLIMLSAFMLHKSEIMIAGVMLGSLRVRPQLCIEYFEMVRGPREPTPKNKKQPYSGCDQQHLQCKRPRGKSRVGVRAQRDH